MWHRSGRSRPRATASSRPRPPLLSTPGDPHSAQIPFRRREEKKLTLPSPPRRPPRAAAATAAPAGGTPLLVSPPGAVHRFQRPRIAARVGWTGRPIAPLQCTARARDRRTPPGDLLSRRDRPGFSAPLPPHQARAPRTESGGRQQDPAKSNT